MDNILNLFNHDWAPRAGARSAQREIDGLFDQLLQDSTRDWSRSGAAPDAEIDETDTHYLVTLDVPGVPKDNIQIEVKNRILRVVAERRADGTPGRARHRHGRWEHRFMIPENVDLDHVEASCEDGVLRIAFPKPEEAKPRLIRIQDGKSGFFQRLLSGGKKEESGKPEIPVQAEMRA